MRKKILVFVASAFLLSCSKDSDSSSSKTFCWECTMKQVISSAGLGNQTSTTTVSQCDLTEDQAKQFEKSGTSTTTTSSGGISATLTMTTTCAKK